MSRPLMPGFKSISETYTYDELKAINNSSSFSDDFYLLVKHHAKYEQTLPFFDEHEQEIIQMVSDICGYSYLGETLSQHKGCYDAYRNDMVWEFIGLVASEVCAEYDRIQWEQDQEIGSYISLHDVTYNAPGSMNEQRYTLS